MPPPPSARSALSGRGVVEVRILPDLFSPLGGSVGTTPEEWALKRRFLSIVNCQANPNFKLSNARKAAQDFKQGDLVPDPSFTLQLSDETLSGSNLLAFQKFFDGEFQFDVFYESRSGQKDLSGMGLSTH